MNRLTWLAVPLAALALALAGCGGDDDEGGSASEDPPAPPTQTAAPTTTQESTGPAPSEAEARETLIRWYATKDCDLMTDEFLEEFTQVSERGTRDQNCAKFKESQLTFDPETIKVTKVQIDGDTARVGAEREGTSESPVYQLTAEGGEWKVSGNCAREPGCMEAYEGG
jgi:hypothetical protein